MHTFDIGLVVKDKNVVFLSYRESFTTFSCEKYLEIRFFLLPLHRIISRIMEFYPSLADVRQFSQSKVIPDEVGQTDKDIININQFIT